MAHEITDRGWRAKAGAVMIVLVWIVLVLSFGYVGYGKNSTKSSSRIYQSLQLFALDGHFEEVNWQLEVARFLAPGGELIGLMLGIVAAVVWWTDRFRLFGLRLKRRKHIVVCGIGAKGLQLVRDFRRAGKPVLAIEKERNNPFIEICDQLGAVVLVGDATKSETLEKAYLRKAEYLIATCGDDGANVEIAVCAQQLLSRRKKANANLPCWIHIVDLELRSLLRQHKILTTQSQPVRVTMFNVFENSARLLFRNHFLDYDKPITDENDPRQVHLVIFGFGQLGESILLQAVKSAHFPNSKHLRVTVIDREATRKHKRFLIRYNSFHELCDAKFIRSEAETPTIFKHVQKWCEDPYSIVTFAVTFDNDSHSLSFGLTLLSQVRQYDCPVFVRTASDAGLAKLLADVNDHSDLICQIQGFGKIQEACSAKVVVDDNLNRFAEMIHAAFLARRQKEGRGPEDPSMKNWQELDPDLKESNWQQAEHIRFKLREIGCGAAPLQDPPAVSAISDSRLETIRDNEALKLARTEHRRWFTERSLAGWRKGNAKDVAQRLHPDMRPWEELTEAVQQYDLDAVRLIPQLLALDKLVMYRTQRRDCDTEAAERGTFAS